MSDCAVCLRPLASVAGDCYYVNGELFHGRCHRNPEYYAVGNGWTPPDPVHTAVRGIFAREIEDATANSETSYHIAWLGRLRDEILTTIPRSE